MLIPSLCISTSISVPVSIPMVYIYKVKFSISGFILTEWRAVEGTDRWAWNGVVDKRVVGSRWVGLPN